MKTISEISKILLEPNTQGITPAPSIKDWASWLNIQTLNDPELEALVEKCGQFANRVKTGKKASWLSLLGKSGTGKTTCAKRLWKWAWPRFRWGGTDFEPHQAYWPELVSDLRSGSAYERVADMRSWPVLFLDDIGAERDTTGFAAEQLNTILGCRVGKWTIITSNLMLDQLGAIDPRIADRVIREPGNLYIELTTQSYALRPI